MTRPDEWLLALLAIAGIVLVLATDRLCEWIHPERDGRSER